MKIINISKSVRIASAFLMFVLTLAMFSSCKDNMEGKTFLTSDERMIDEYIEQQKDADMTEFLKIADKAGFRGMLHAYGTNTCFIPTNNAIKSYFGKTSWESLPVDSLERFMKYHIVRDSLKSDEFVDGRLSKANMLGKFLTTKTVQSGDLVSIQVNRQANIITKDIHVANGIIHKIDQVLQINKRTVGEVIKTLPDNYSIFKDIMSESGMTDTLINNKENWYTVFLQSNESFATAGITNRGELIAKMAIAQPDYASDPAKLIQMYAQYHCVKRLAYIADLSLSSAELTFAPNQVITFKTNKDSLILNEYQSLTKFEKGVEVDKKSDWTDYSCYNGVLIDLVGYIQPVKRSAEAVYWDMAEQPEIKSAKEFRRPNSTLTFKPGELSEFNFGGINNPTVSYWCGSGAYSSGGQYVYNDNLNFSLRPNIVQWCEIKTPVLTEGTYYVWLSWRRAGSNQKFKTTFKQDGKPDQVMPDICNLSDYFPTNTSPEVNLNVGWKRYTAKDANNVMCCFRLGAIKVEYTGRHILRFDALGGSTSIAFDMLHFIPADQNQLWPRFDMTGKAIYPGTACNEIYPTTLSCSGDLNN